MHRRISILVLAGAGLIVPGCNGPSRSNPSPATRPASVAPGVNDPYADVQDVGVWVERFEREGREVYAKRSAIAQLVTSRIDATLADVGAGTGLFTMLLARRLSEGRVVAVDIVPQFLQHIRELADRTEFANVDTVLCTEDSVELAPDSIDLAFICDTYHHFEYPRETMGSLHAALRPGGEVFVVDFQRIPGQSSDWILEHVRAGREIVIAEITSYGFELVEDLTETVGLESNYMLRFRRAAR
jgi:ubiquinone/menaquinone biosynthesis C-methylase UbiE